MLNDIKIEFFEDQDLKNKSGELKLHLIDFAQLGIIIENIRKSQNDFGSHCHFKITAQSFDL